MIGKVASAARRRYWQLLYWTTIGLHVHLPKANGSYVVLGYGHSGTNWLCNLLSDYLDIPVFKAWVRYLPAITPQIFHMHRFIKTQACKKRTIYLYRDGRDVIVSSYFKVMNEPWNPKQRSLFEKYVGESMDENKVSQQLPAFIDWSFSIRKASSIPWHKHIDLAMKNNYVTVSYEDLKQDAVTALGHAIQKLTSNSIDQVRLEKVVAKNDFSLKVKDGNRYQLRSGRTNDWKRYFNHHSASRFHHFAGQQLISLGYEPDAAWIDKLKLSVDDASK